MPETDRATQIIETPKGNGEAGKTETRKGNTPIYVWVTPSEKQIINANAKACGMSMSAYLRQVGIGMPIKSILDQQCVADLAKVNADPGLFNA